MSTSPHHVTNAALKGIFDDVADRLGRHRSLIYAMGEDPEKDRYSRFLVFWHAVADVDFEKADLFFRDFEARRNARQPARTLYRTTEKKALASVTEKIADVMKSHLEGKADHEKLMDIAEAEEALRKLSQAIHCRANGNGQAERRAREEANAY